MGDTCTLRTRPHLLTTIVFVSLQLTAQGFPIMLIGQVDETKFIQGRIQY